MKHLELSPRSRCFVFLVVIGLVVLLFYMIGEIVFSIENSTREGETLLYKAGLLRRIVILG